MPHPIDPEMAEENTSRVLISNEVLMTQILLKIKDLVREDIAERVDALSEAANSSIKSTNSSAPSKKSSSFKDTRPILKAVESRVFSPSKINKLVSEVKRKEVAELREE
jgi:hypothetical protein